MSLVTIDMPLVYQGKFTADQFLAFGKPSHVKIVEGAITRIVIKANNAYGGWYDEKKAYYDGEKTIAPKMIRTRLNGALVTLAALGFDVRLVYGGEQEGSFP
jgi:hypothetical protein